MKKSLDFEINLLPVISLLAVCISFLLLTAVWVQIGSSDISQAMGSEAQKQEQKEPTLWVEFSEAGLLNVTLKDSPRVSKSLRKLQLRRGSKGKFNWAKLDNFAARLKEELPQLKTAMILPKKNSSYDNIIRVIDGFRKNEILDIGVAPL